MFISRFSYFCNKTYLIALSLWLNMSVLFSINNFHKNCSFNTMSPTCLPVNSPWLCPIGRAVSTEPSRNRWHCTPRRAMLSVVARFLSISNLNAANLKAGFVLVLNLPLKLSLFRVRRRWREMRMNKKKKKNSTYIFSRAALTPSSDLWLDHIFCLLHGTKSKRRLLIVWESNQLVILQCFDVSKLSFWERASALYCCWSKGVENIVSWQPNLRSCV